LKRDGTRAETTFRLSAKRTSPFKSAGASVQSTTGSRGVRISGSNAGYTTFRGSVKSTVTSFPFTSSTVRHRVPLRFNWTLPQTNNCFPPLSNAHHPEHNATQPSSGLLSASTQLPCAQPNHKQARPV